MLTAINEDLLHIYFKNRSVFKPFIFLEGLGQIEDTRSPSYGADDPVKKQPRFQTKPDRKHKLFVKHELVASISETYKVHRIGVWLTLLKVS